MIPAARTHRHGVEQRHERSQRERCHDHGLRDREIVPLPRVPPPALVHAEHAEDEDAGEDRPPPGGVEELLVARRNSSVEPQPVGQEVRDRDQGPVGQRLRDGMTVEREGRRAEPTAHRAIVARRGAATLTRPLKRPGDRPTTGAMLRAGILGATDAGLVQARALATLGDLVRVVGVHDVVASASQRLADETGAEAFTDIDALLGTVDVVVVCSSTELHADQALRATAAGVDVLLERPVVARPQELMKLHAAIARAPQRPVVQAGHHVLFDPLLRRVLRTLAPHEPAMVELRHQVPSGPGRDDGPVGAGHALRRRQCAASADPQRSCVRARGEPATAQRRWPGARDGTDRMR